MFQHTWLRDGRGTRLAIALLVGELECLQEVHVIEGRPLSSSQLMVDRTNLDLHHGIKRIGLGHSQSRVSHRLRRPQGDQGRILLETGGNRLFKR